MKSPFRFPITVAATGASGSAGFSLTALYIAPPRTARLLTKLPLMLPTAAPLTFPNGAAVDFGLIVDKVAVNVADGSLFDVPDRAAVVFGAVVAEITGN